MTLPWAPSYIRYNEAILTQTGSPALLKRSTNLERLTQARLKKTLHNNNNKNITNITKHVIFVKSLG